MVKEFYNVLLVDDDEDEHFLINDFLEDSTLHCQLDWARNESECLSALEKKQYDLIFIDFYLGKKNGLEVAETLKKERGSIPPYVLLTGQNRSQLDLKALRSGAADYLSKEGINTAVLERVIRYTILREVQMRALRDERQKFEQLFKASLDPIVLIGDHGKVNLWNDSFVDWFPKVERDLLLSNCIGREEESLETLQRLSEEKQLLKITSAQGDRFCTVGFIDQSHIEDGIRFQVIFHDVSAQKRLMEEQSNKEKAAFAEKMVRLIAHEVRNPLTNIHLSSDQLNSGFSDTDEDEKYYIGIISRNADRINNLVDLLLDSSGPSEIRLEEVDISAFMRETADLVADRLEMEEATLRLTVSGEGRMMIDPKKMQLAFSNLLKNAIEAMQGEEKGILEFSFAKKKDHLEFRISDNGIGMDSATRSEIFKPFFSSKQSGKGLGLTLTKNIVDAHKGTITCESTLGKGTTFTVKIAG